MPSLTIFCDYSFDDAARKLLQEETTPHRLIFPATLAGTVLDLPPADAIFAEADIALGQSDVKSVLGSNRLRWVQVTSAGFTRYDTPEFRVAAKERGLRLTNSSQVFAEACAEHVFSFMLAQARQLPVALQTRMPTSSPQWRKLRDGSKCLTGGSVVILGFGTIAARLVELLAPFNMKISAMRREPKGNEGISIFVPDDLRAALQEADHVIDILPENPDSRHFMNAERFGWMKPGALFYNIGRGTTVDQAALAAGLASGQVGTAWLDVTEPEPLPDGHPLLTAPNCYLTPHTAGGHGHENESLVRHFLANFQRYLRDEPLRDRVI